MNKKWERERERERESERENNTSLSCVLFATEGKKLSAWSVIRDKIPMAREKKVFVFAPAHIRTTNLDQRRKRKSQPQIHKQTDRHRLFD